MAEHQAKNRLVWGLIGIIVVVVLIYGVGKLLTSNAASVVGINAGRIEANNNFSFSHSKSWSGDSIFQARRIAIHKAGDHPVLDQVVEQLREALLAQGYVDEVDIFGPGETHEPGTRLYDSYLTLWIDVQQDDKPFVERDFKATLHLTAGTMPYHSRSSYHDHLSVPSLSYSLTGELNHTSQSTQAGTPYKMIAENIGKEVAGKLTEQFTEWREAFGGDMDWPDGLTGEYPDDPWIPWPPGIDQDVLVDGYGLMQHRHALWQIKTGNPQAVVQAFHKAYTDAGWRIDQGAIIENDELNSRYHFRAWDGAPHQVEVFEVRDGLGPRKAGGVSLICVRYHHRFDRRETRAVIDELLIDDAGLPVLKYLSGQLGREQRIKYMQMLEASQPTDPRDHLALAEYHHRNGRTDKARLHVMQASLLTYRTHDPSAFRGKLREAGKKMGFDEGVTNPTITREVLEKMGYRPVGEMVGQQPAIGLNEAVQFYCLQDGEIQTADLWLDRDPANPELFRFNHYERHGPGATSHGHQGASSDSRVHCTWDVRGASGRYTVHLLQSEADPDRFDVEITRD